jgi:hypothetical protein
MLAIVTKYYGPTNTKGSRIVASYDGRRATVAYDHGLSIDGNHKKAAKAFAAKAFSGPTRIAATGWLTTGSQVHIIR